jgi:alpha-N-arabinofuranosidase
MSMAGRQMNGLSLHYYTIPTGNWSRKGAATQFSEDDWHATLLGTLRMDELISKHSLIMDKYDARKRVGMIVDEWGTWYDVEPGTNPGFLYQQNTLRDALVAALNFHIFQAHADRVAMANIAQTINVLQAMILTDKEKLLVTPTYHVFEMFKIHQGARTLPVDLISPDYVRGGRRMAAISVSATKKEGGPAHMTLANTDPNKPVEVEISLRGLAAKSVSGRILTASEMNAHNTFAAPATVAPKTFEGAKITGESLRLTMPAKSVVVLALE